MTRGRTILLAVLLAALLIVLPNLAGCDHHGPLAPVDTPQRTKPAQQQSAHSEPIDCLGTIKLRRTAEGLL
jgi:predicted small lipoprotein YifL